MSGYTADDDAYIVANFRRMTIRAMAETLGRSPSTLAAHVRLLQRRGMLNPLERAGSRPWTAQDDQELRGRVGWESFAEIAVALGRSLGAVKCRASRLGIAVERDRCTLAWVADFFGVGHKTVRQWVARGWLKGKRTDRRRGRRQLWQIDMASIEAFILEHPEHYDWHALPRETHWRELGRRAAAAQRYLTMEQAARRLGVHPSTVRRHCRHGWLPATRTVGLNPAGDFRVREADLRHFRARRPDLVGRKRRAA